MESSGAENMGVTYAPGGLEIFEEHHFGIELDSYVIESNEEQLTQMIRDGLTVKQAIDRYSSNFLEWYSGYHSR